MTLTKDDMVFLESLEIEIPHSEQSKRVFDHIRSGEILVNQELVKLFQTKLGGILPITDLLKIEIEKETALKLQELVKERIKSDELFECDSGDQMVNDTEHFKKELQSLVEESENEQ